MWKIKRGQTGENEDKCAESSGANPIKEMFKFFTLVVICILRSIMSL